MLSCRRHHSNAINISSFAPFARRSQYQQRVRKLKKVAEERDALVERLRASGAMGTSLSDMKKIAAATGDGAVLGGSSSNKSLPPMRRMSSMGRGQMTASASMTALAAKSK